MRISAKPYVVLMAMALIVPAAARAQTTQLLNVAAVLPGQTLSLDALQSAPFPLGAQHFFVAVLGSGTLGISLAKSDRAGDYIFIAGLVSSSAGTKAIARAGVSKGVLSQIFDIGEGGGFIWLWSGIVYSASDPPYSYQVRFSLAP